MTANYSESVNASAIDGFLHGSVIRYIAGRPVNSGTSERLMNFAKGDVNICVIIVS
jgi:hypothetical protein